MHEESAWAEFLALLQDPAHWAFEITGEAVSSLVAYPFIRMAVRVWVARHDAAAHAVVAVPMAEEANVS